MANHLYLGSLSGFTDFSLHQHQLLLWHMGLIWRGIQQHPCDHPLGPINYLATPDLVLYMSPIQVNEEKVFLVEIRSCLRNDRPETQAAICSSLVHLFHREKNTLGCWCSLSCWLSLLPDHILYIPYVGCVDNGRFSSAIRDLLREQTGVVQ